MKYTQQEEEEEEYNQPTTTINTRRRRKFSIKYVSFTFSLIESSILFMSLIINEYYPQLLLIIRNSLQNILLFPNISLIIFCLVCHFIFPFNWLLIICDASIIIIYQFYIIIMFCGPIQSIKNGGIILLLMNFIYINHDIFVNNHIYSINNTSKNQW